jgi:hypothetical protein
MLDGKKGCDVGDDGFDVENCWAEPGDGIEALIGVPEEVVQRPRTQPTGPQGSIGVGDDGVGETDDG